MSKEKLIATPELASPFLKDGRASPESVVQKAFNYAHIHYTAEDLPPIEISKTYPTRCGDTATILAIVNDLRFPIIGYVNRKNGLQCSARWNKNGLASNIGRVSGTDIIRRPLEAEKPKAAEFEVGKSYLTRGGHLARVLALGSDGGGKWLVGSVRDDKLIAVQWLPDGRCTDAIVGCGHSYDLILPKAALAPMRRWMGLPHPNGSSRVMAEGFSPEVAFSNLFREVEIADIP